MTCVGGAHTITLGLDKTIHNGAGAFTPAPFVKPGPLNLLIYPGKFGTEYAYSIV